MPILGLFHSYLVLEKLIVVKVSTKLLFFGARKSVPFSGQFWNGSYFKSA
jgi:hypothetical protein